VQEHVHHFDAASIATGGRKCRCVRIIDDSNAVANDPGYNQAPHLVEATSDCDGPKNSKWKGL